MEKIEIGDVMQSALWAPLDQVVCVGDRETVS